MTKREENHTSSKRFALTWIFWDGAVALAELGWPSGLVTPLEVETVEDDANEGKARRQTMEPIIKEQFYALHTTSSPKALLGDDAPCFGFGVGGAGNTGPSLECGLCTPSGIEGTGSGKRRNYLHQPLG